MRAVVVVVSLVAACGESGTPPDRTVEEHGPYGAGTTRFDSGGLTLQAFYPTDAAETELAFEALEPEPHRTQYAGLLAAADPACPTRRLSVALDAAPAPGAFPLIIYSHCFTCTRLNGATTAARLASHGFVVLAVDHPGSALWNRLAGDDTGLTGDALDARVADLELALAADHPALASADRARLGSLGHSFGAVTAGRLAVEDNRIAAAFALAAPIDSPLFPGIGLPGIPLAFLVAREDNSISEFGNKLIRDNFAASPNPVWKLELADAGHWSVSDEVGLVDAFRAGCGAATRQTDGTDFTYRDPAAARAITASYVTAFFRATLAGDPGARAYLEGEFPDDGSVDSASR